MMDAGAIWGLVITGYIFVGVILVGMGNGDGQRPVAPPGSTKTQIWDDREKRGRRLILIWIVGLAAVLGAWRIFS